MCLNSYADNVKNVLFFEKSKNLFAAKKSARGLDNADLAYTTIIFNLTFTNQ